MNFFLDENFPRKAAALLEAAGFNVFDIRGSKFEGEDDSDIFARALQQQVVREGK